ncbi:hypothetical protein K491DRAFT_57105 [Lophiostoma macrostomum CBS 122681]|uniref:DUF7730 domain-containing protein n=1 Tax=Lophiostoma macrostomum CBS 122681 TaxID=1314788 RepID=A0A6A6SXG4_9PLEO|nr:hypothetical protein K491DRAFT_57105 [Lophiostoma macrostomum CBS 122681]
MAQLPPLTWRSGGTEKPKKFNFWKGGRGLRMEHGQSQSPLFSKLPPELRMLIWKYVFADQEVLHIASGSSGPMVIKCKSAQVDTGRIQQDSQNEQAHARDHHLRCMEYFWEVTVMQDYSGRPRVCEPWDGMRLGVLSLLLTCRTVYNEAIPILYGNNTFCFFYDEDFVRFARHVPRKHLAAIKSLALYKGNYTRILETVAQYLNLMSGLQSCEIPFLELAHGQSYWWQRNHIGASIETCLDWVNRLEYKDCFTVHLVQCHLNQRAKQNVDPPYWRGNPRLDSEATFRRTETWVIKEAMDKRSTHI